MHDRSIKSQKCCQKHRFGIVPTQSASLLNEFEKRFSPQMCTFDRDMLKKLFKETDKHEIEAHVLANLGRAFEISRKVARPGRRHFFLGGFDKNQQDSLKL